MYIYVYRYISVFGLHSFSLGYYIYWYTLTCMIVGWGVSAGNSSPSVFQTQMKPDADTAERWGLTISTPGVGSPPKNCDM